MNESTTDAVVDELIAKAVSHLEPVAVQLGDALGNLENREVLATIGALMGCEEAISSANLVLIIARDYAEKLARARAEAHGGKDQPVTALGSQSRAITDLTQASRDSASKVSLPDAEFDALAAVGLIASGYEFNCPSCQTHNKLIAIPKHGTAVECHNCHARFKVDEANHAQE